MVTPIYYIFFTSFVILASGILFKEWTNLQISDILGSVCGFLTTIIGIFQMQLFKDVNITLTQLRYLLRRKGTNSDSDSGGYRFELLPPEFSSFLKNPELFKQHLFPNHRKSYTEPVIHSEDENSPYNSEVDVHQASQRVEV